LQDWGETLLAAGRLEEAAAVAEEIIAANRTLGAAHHLRAEALIQAGRPRAALPSVAAALRLSPRDVSYWLSAGRWLRAAVGLGGKVS
jgi:tetratricopeptide (TPR) repeat protein